MIANILYNGPTFAKYRRENGENISQIENTSPDCKQVPQYHGVQVTILMHFRNPLRPELHYQQKKSPYSILDASFLFIFPPLW